MDRLKAMSILLAVVETGSFTAAAKALRIPLPTISRRVNELENHLGARLLLRTTRKLVLTDAGQVYVQAARRILEEVEEVERIATGEYHLPRGELVLTAPLLFGRLHLLPVVTEFLAAYPEINIRLVLSDRNLHLLEEHVDMAVRIGVLPDSSMVATRVGEMRRVVCASPALLAKYGKPVKPQALAALPAVAIDFAAEPLAWRFKRAGKGANVVVPLAPRLLVSTVEAAIEAAIQSVGVTRAFLYQCVDAVRDGTLELLLRDYEPEPVPVNLLHVARGALPSKGRVFLDFATERLRQRLKVIESSAGRKNRRAAKVR